MKNPFRKKQKRTAVWLSDPSAYDILCADGYKPLSKNEEIIKCANIIADLVSSMTIMLMKNGENGDVRVKNELSKKIDIYPNKYMTRKNFIFKIAKDLIISGNSIAIPKVTADGLLDDIQLVDMSKVTFQSDTDSYKIRIGTVDFDPDELLHFVHIPRLDKPFEGEGYKSAIIDTVENLIQANATKKGFLRSKWKPSMVISINSDAEELQDKDKRKAILGSYTDTTEAGEPWIIPAGEIDVKTIQPLTLNDLAIPDSIKIDKQALAAAIGIPAFMVGVGAFNKDEYNNFVSTKIMSIAMIIQQELTKKTLYSPDMYWKLSPKSLMQYSLDEKRGFIKDMVGGGLISRNEGRNEFDYSPADKPGMNDYIVLENYVPVEKVGDQKKLKGGDNNSE